VEKTFNELEQEQKHISAVKKEKEQVIELLRRGSIRHYFLGPESIWSKEGFGTVAGGFLTTFFGGFLLPRLFLYGTTNDGLKYLCWAMTAVGILILIKGLYLMIKESRTDRKPVPDKVHDEILEYDIEGLKKISKQVLKTNILKLVEDENIDQMDMVLVKGPREYVHNVNLPLVWKLGDDGKIRYSNFSTMVIYFGANNLYIYTSIFNMRNGTSKFEHTYECPYDKIKFVGLEDRIIETVTQKNKKISQKLQMFVINAGDDESDELAISVKDYEIMEKSKGYFNISDAEKAIDLILARKEERAID